MRAYENTCMHVSSAPNYKYFANISAWSYIAQACANAAKPAHRSIGIGTTTKQTIVDTPSFRTVCVESIGMRHLHCQPITDGYL